MALDVYEMALRFKSEGFAAVSKDMDTLDKKGKGISKAFTALKASLVVGAVGGFIRKIAVESIEAQKQTAQLNAVIKSTGGIAGVTADDIDKMAGSLQKTTVFSDEAIKSAASLLLTFTNIRGEVFKKTMPAILDLSQAMGTDLNTSVIQVGKALNDPIKGVTALQRVGVSFTGAQKDVIKNLVETNRLAEAQGIILKELQTEFGGSAEAARKTLGGALAGLSNSWGDLFEVTQESSKGIIGAINSLTDNLPAVRDKFDSFFEFLKKGFTGLKIGYMQDAADIQRVLGFFAGLSSKVTFGARGDALAQMSAGMKAEAARLDREIANARHGAGNRADDPLSERAEIEAARAAMGGGGRIAPPPGGEADAGKASKALDERIKLMGEALIFDDLRAKAGTALASIENSLKKQLDAGNLSLEKRLDLEQKLVEVRTSLTDKARIDKMMTLSKTPTVSLTPLPGGVDPFASVRGPLETLGEDKIKKLPELINKGGKKAVEAMTQLKSDMDAAMAGLSQTLGDGIYNAFAMAFNGESLGSIFKEFGKTVLAGVGQIFTMMGQAYLSYGLVMSGLVPSLTNPFTAGPAAIAIGAALVALGGALGAIAARGNGPGRGTAQAGAFRERSSDVVRLKFVDRPGMSSNLSPVQPIVINAYGPNDPKTQRWMMETLTKATRR